MAPRHFRAMALMAAAAPLGLALIALPAAPAQAASGDLSCSATLNLSFSPALVVGGSSTAQIGGNVSGCTSSNGQHSDLTSGPISGSGSGTGASNPIFPCGVSPNGSGTGTITWSTGATSTVSWQVQGTSFTATVTDGQLSGDAITASLNGLPQATCDPTTGGMSAVSVAANVSFA
ncbi:hypothetical protein IU500_01305 [Nocardia terpenica]|uniref:hypothetical protein n=1 Tax=Nocardia terpenica TaxID=455432 RepID=UPI00189376E7|nr:hypothetical protein [Nocardia terpenica]MBF6059787.1 hypothetical protein [Nocardia terpenica]MBF6102672.1 hypothetical protein [Nocardia terpenica]MBF6111137.1 hypothetical protein [Nocardia terpenica]MBF6117268.1 hypothetical protein [Nocardia terpenica]MBF6150891.1 hypothetical protein [Nocardia terpenica]